jgi:hypothetical protein
MEKSSIFRRKYLHKFQQGRQGMVWREPGEELYTDCISVTVKHSPSKMFWGCFSWNGLGPIVLLNGTVTGLELLTG